jgi:hypothetical protein
MLSVSYFCEECGQEKTLASGLPAPQCCGEPMRPRLADPPPHAMTAEADRFEDEDDAFDDGVH